MIPLTLALGVALASPEMDARRAEIEARRAALEQEMARLEAEEEAIQEAREQEEEAQEALEEAKAEAQEALEEAQAEAQEAADDAHEAALEAADEAHEAALEAAEEAIQAARDAAEEAGSEAISAGGVRVEPGTVLDAAVALGGPLDVYGTVEGDAVSLGGPIRIYPGGLVEGDAVSLGHDIQVDAGGSVQGDAVSMGGQVIVEPGGAVGGDRVGLGDRGIRADALGSVGPNVAGGALGWLHDLFRHIAAMAAFAGAGVLLVGLWPRQVARVASRVVEQPLWVGVAGGILTMAMLVGASMLAVTILGLPLSLLMVVGLAVAWLFGLVAFCTAAGERMPAVAGYGHWAAFLAGAAVLSVISLIPVFGTVFVMALGFPAVGAALITRFGTSEAAVER